MAALDALFHLITCLPNLIINDTEHLSFWTKMRYFVESLKVNDHSASQNISYELIDLANDVLFAMQNVSSPNISSDLKLGQIFFSKNFNKFKTGSDIFQQKFQQI